MQEKTVTPALCAALGAAASYYGFAPVLSITKPLPYIAGSFFVIIAALSFLRVVSQLYPGSYALSRYRLLALFFAAGFVLGLSSLGAARRAAVVQSGLPFESVTGLSGVLLDDPRTSASGRGNALLKLRESAGAGGVRVSARGTVRVFFPEEAVPRVKEFGRGSRLYVEGKYVQTARELLFRASSVHITAPPGAFDAMRSALRLSLTRFFSDSEWGGLSLALLLGIKDKLSGTLAEKYRDAGCSYILALSGMHLAIVSSIIAFLLRKPLGKKAAAAAGALFIVLYILLVGPQPSLVRAGISYLIGAAAAVFTQKAAALQLLALSFLIQLCVDPASGGTVSFMLSYLALAGILIAGEPLAAVMRGRLPAFAAGPLAASLGAFLATLALCAALFGSVRPVGIIAGLVIAPLTSVFMIGSILYLVIYPLIPPLGALAGKALSLLYMALSQSASLAAKAPELPVICPPLFVLVSIAAPCVLLYFCARRAKARSYLEAFD